MHISVSSRSSLQNEFQDSQDYYTEQPFFCNPPQKKSLFQFAETLFRYSGPKCSPKHLDQGVFQGKRPHLVILLSNCRRKFVQANSLTDAKLAGTS